jgi:succinate-acetate transporter protein
VDFSFSYQDLMFFIIITLFLIFVLSICKSYEEEIFSVGGRVGVVRGLPESGV